MKRYVLLSLWSATGLVALASACGDDTSTSPGGDGGAPDGTTSGVDAADGASAGDTTTPIEGSAFDAPVEGAPSGEGGIAEAGDARAGDAADASDATDASGRPRVVYVGANDPTSGLNRVLAYAQAPDGTLSPLAGSPFATGGTGVSNPAQVLGPDDTDQDVVLSADKSRLFAVNGGSNTVAVFDVHDDGSLTPVPGSPFASGGLDPASVALAGQFAYIVNEDEDPLQDGGTIGPNYTAFTLGANGSMTPIPNSTVPAGKSPQMALATPDGKLLFGVDFMAPLAASPSGPLRAFSIGVDGRLTAAPGTPMSLPAYDGGMPPGLPAALGLALHPTQKVLYVGFVMRQEIAAYTYDPTSGALTYAAAAPVSGPAPCWIRASADGTRLYAIDTGDDSVSVLDSSNALSPSEIQHLQLMDTGPTDDAGATASASFEESLSPDGRYLFVVSQRVTTDSNVTAGNILHTLSVGLDGMLAETVPDVKLPVPVNARPQGVAVR
jgi:6-phosphogluconolactonase (cycloisomerase 2 family)